MHGQRLLTLAIVAAVLVIHLAAQVAVAKPAKTRQGVQLRGTRGPGTRTSTATDDDEDDTDVVSAECVISAVNFVIATLNNIIPDLGAGIAVCIDACDIGTAECVSCIITLIPPIPLIPTAADLAGCS